MVGRFAYSRHTAIKGDLLKPTANPGNFKEAFKIRFTAQVEKGKNGFAASVEGCQRRSAIPGQTHEEELQRLNRKERKWGKDNGTIALRMGRG